MKKLILCLLTCLMLSCTTDEYNALVYYKVEDFKITEIVDSDVYTFRGHCGEKLEKYEMTLVKDGDTTYHKFVSNRHIRFVKGDSICKVLHYTNRWVLKP